MTTPSHGVPPGRRFRAVIFDMDGVIADSEPTYLEAINAVLGPHGASVTPQEYEEVIGTSVHHTWEVILGRFGIDGDLEDYVRRYDRTLVELLRRPLPTLPGVRELLVEVRRRRLVAALCSSSWKAWVEALLQATGMAAAFDAVVWREMAPRSKPAPDLYLKAAELISVPAPACVALEDTGPGIDAARAAGMFAVHVRAASTALPPIEAADLVLESLSDFPLEILSPGA